MKVLTEVLGVDEDVGNGALSGHLGEGVLHGLAVLALVELDDLEGDALLVEESLHLGAEGAGCLAEDEHLVLLLQGLDLGLEPASGLDWGHLFGCGAQRSNGVAWERAAG